MWYAVKDNLTIIIFKDNLMTPNDLIQMGIFATAVLMVSIPGAILLMLPLPKSASKREVQISFSIVAISLVLGLFIGLGTAAYSDTITHMDTNYIWYHDNAAPYQLPSDTPLRNN